MPSERLRGRDAAKGFGDEFEKRGEAEVKDKWKGIADALYSEDPLDWERVVGKFDSKDLDSARSKIDDFLLEMGALGKLDEEQMVGLRDTLHGTIGDMEERNLLEMYHADAIQENVQFELRRKQAIEESTIAAERFLNSFDGIIGEQSQNHLEQDFRGIAAAMESSDWTKFERGFADLPAMQARVHDVTDAMAGAGRVSEESATVIRRNIDDFVTGEQRSRDAIEEAKRSAEAFRISYAGIVEEHAKAKLEEGFRGIARAMSEMDWRPMARGFRDMGSMRTEVERVGSAMFNMGRITEEQLGFVIKSLEEASLRMEDFGNQTDAAGKKGLSLSGIFKGIVSFFTTGNILVKIMVLLIASAAGQMAALGSGITSTIVALAASLVNAGGAIIPLAAGFAGIVLSLALAKTELKDMYATMPAFHQAVVNLKDAWTDQARAFGQAWSGSLTKLVTDLNRAVDGSSFGTGLGRAMAGITTAFDTVINSPGFHVFMQAMSTTIPQAVQFIGTGFASLFGTLITLLGAAAPMTRIMAGEFQQWASGIQKTVAAAAASGELQRFLQVAHDSLKTVLDLVGSVGHALGVLFQTGGGAGNQLLTMLTGVINKFNAWAQTMGGQNALETFFAHGIEVMKAIEPLITGLAKGLASLVTPQAIANLGRIHDGYGRDTSGTRPVARRHQ